MSMCDGTNDGSKEKEATDGGVLGSTRLSDVACLGGRYPDPQDSSRYTKGVGWDGIVLSRTFI
jgi:hypothetical protein